MHLVNICYKFQKEQKTTEGFQNIMRLELMRYGKTQKSEVTDQQLFLYHPLVQPHQLTGAKSQTFCETSLSQILQSSELHDIWFYQGHVTVPGEIYDVNEKWQNCKLDWII